jgi:ubiquinone/menaquinone biosynthesis C-methylase UbiE
MAQGKAVYMHGHHESVLSSHRWRTAENSAAYLLGHLRPGDTLLDVGCGPGTITADLAAAVAPGRVTGVDASAAALAEARAFAAARELSEVEFAVADVYALDYADDSFDVVHAHQVLQHLTDPVRALREMRRVCRPGGIVAARDADFAAMAWYPQSPGMTEWLSLYQRVARANGGEPDAGRRLVSWARQAGFLQLTATASTWCFATPEERIWWSRSWGDRMVDSAVARHAIAGGHADEATLRRLRDAWYAWAEAEDGWFAVVHGEIVCRA